MSPEKIEATISGARGNATTFKMECANQSTRINLRDSARVSVAFFFSFRSMHRIRTINSLDFTRTYEAQLVLSRISTSSFSHLSIFFWVSRSQVAQLLCTVSLTRRNFHVLRDRQRQRCNNGGSNNGLIV